jgi:hypothetical protein
MACKQDMTLGSEDDASNTPHIHTMPDGVLQQPMFSVTAVELHKKLPPLTACFHMWRELQMKR